MGRFTQFCGLMGLVLLIFGAVVSEMVNYDRYYFTWIHLIGGCLLLLIFLLSGGFAYLRSSAVKRAVGFGSGLILYSVLFLTMLVGVNYAAYRYDLLYFDSTSQKVYSLAPQTKEVLNKLEYPVLIRAFYVSGQMDERVRTLLNRLKKSSSKIEWKLVDAEKSPTLVEKYGINQSGTLHFSYDVPDSTREAKVSGEVSEQEVVNSILKLTRGGAKKVYFLQGHGEPDMSNQEQTGYLFLKEAIEGENIEPVELRLGEEGSVPEDAAALLIIAPRKELLPDERNAVQSYLEGGGNLLMLYEPRTTPDIVEFAKLVGIEIGQDVVVDQVMRLFEGASLGVQPMVSLYTKHPITEGFKKGTIYSITSSVRSAKGKEAEITELAYTSDKSWAESDIEKLFGENPEASKDAKDIPGPVPVAAAYEGVVMKGAKQASRVVVFGDSDFVANINIRQLFNRDFFLNALNWVVGEDDGITIRARTLKQSVQGITKEQFDTIFLFAAILLPEFILLGGFSVWWIRKS